MSTEATGITQQRVYKKKANNKRSCMAKSDTTATSIQREMFCKVPGGVPGMDQKLETWPSSIITLSKPGDDEECPISLELIKDSKLDWLPPGSCFVNTRPDLTKATLSCNHSFSALSLAYLWLKMDMRCPCCRVGHAFRASEASIPSHIRRKMVSYVKEQLKKEKTKDEADSLRDTQALFGMARITAFQIPYASLADHGDLSLSVTIFREAGSQESLTPLMRIPAVFCVTLYHQGSCFAPNANQLKTIANQLKISVISMSFHVILRMPGSRTAGTEGVCLESSDLVTMSSLLSNQQGQGAGGPRASTIIPGLGGQLTSSESAANGGTNNNNNNNNVKSNFHVSFDEEGNMTELFWIPNDPYLQWFTN